jgi:D-serine deaminase-like pyridoxal phosphate-dependent protein
MSWYAINNIDTIDTPALAVYKQRVQDNIDRAISMIKDVSKLRPHVKTNKMSEVCKMMMDAGITKFKCATIAEAEMLAILQAKDVLLAYQPVGPKAKRFLQLVLQYPQTAFSCLIDNIESAIYLSGIFSEKYISADIFFDINTGMNRTGIKPADAVQLLKQIQSMPNINFIGLHGYDGHIRDTNVDERQHKSDGAFSKLIALTNDIEEAVQHPIKIIVGGSPTFPTHINRQYVECSPGTFIFWDWGYKHTMPDEPFDYAALVITRVISIVDEHTITLDLGHKSVAAENALTNRVFFLNEPGATAVGQSEEHLVLEVGDSSKHTIGDVWYGVPVHICPTVALYDKAVVVENNEAIDKWKVAARDRSINI